MRGRATVTHQPGRLRSTRQRTAVCIFVAEVMPWPLDLAETPLKPTCSPQEKLHSIPYIEIRAAGHVVICATAKIRTGDHTEQFHRRRCNDSD